MESRESAFVLGQRYTLATLALAVALLSFLNLAGVEKAILAIVLGLKALSARSSTSTRAASQAGPGWPSDSGRRTWC